MVVILTLSLTLNFLFIIALFVYFIFLRKYSSILSLFNKKDSAIVDENLATDFFGKDISW